MRRHPGRPICKAVFLWKLSHGAHSSTDLSNQRYYDVVAEELLRKSLRPGLWARAIADSGGEGDAAKALYIRLRVAELVQIDEIANAQAAADEKRRAEEERRVGEKRRADEQRRADEKRAVEERQRDMEMANRIEERRIHLQRATSRYLGPVALWIIVGFGIVILILAALNK